MAQRFVLPGGAVALAIATLLGCASKPAEPPLVAVTSTRSSMATSTTTTMAPLSRDQIAAIVASPDRSAADRTNDLRRHPVDMFMFVAARPGWTALDVSTGGGYTTELLARVIGPTGLVYAQSRPRNPTNPPPKPVAPEGGAVSPPPTATAAPRTTADMLADRSAEMKAAGIAAAPIAYVALPFDNPVPPEAVGKLDLVTLMFNYHDFGFLGVDRASTNRAIFAALKPGGYFVIADHAGRPGTGISESGTLHRIEESFLRAEVEAAGFRLAAEGDFLRNPNDPRDQNTPNPPQPKDEFVLKFVKP
jgi:predicted methyltransferase